MITVYYNIGPYNAYKYNIIIIKYNVYNKLLIILNKNTISIHRIVNIIFFL